MATASFAGPGPSQRFAILSCGQSIQSEPIYLNRQRSDMLLALENVDTGGPTVSRFEFKSTFNKTVLAKRFKMLKQELSKNKIKMKFREEAPKGQIAVTETEYSTSFVYSTVDGYGIKFEEKSMKLRIREYFNLDPKTGVRTRSDYSDAKKFVEYKLVDPVSAYVSNKHRLRVNDEDVIYFTDPSLFIKNRAELEERLILDPLNIDRTFVQGMLNMQAELFAAAGERPLIPQVLITYQREARQVVLRTKEGAEFKIQFTFDSNVKLLNVNTSKVVKAYPSKMQVVEIKVDGDPYEFLSLSADELKNPTTRTSVEKVIPGYTAVLDFIQMAKSEIEDGFLEDRGKFYHFRYVLP
jgi:hypothetical protein